MIKAKKIVFTGGHHTSALVVADELRKKGFQIIWLGHKYTMVGINNVSLEFQDVTKRKIKFFELKTGKFHRSGLKSWLKLVNGFFQAFLILKKEKPDFIVSFGGYLAVPVVIAGKLLGIEAVTHEQTSCAGLANRFLGKIVKKVFITWRQSAGYFPAQKTLLTGLPIRRELLITRRRKKFFNNHRKTILVTGGKQGSQTINAIILSLLPRLLDKYNLIHQAGETSTTSDWENLNQFKKNLPAKIAGNYFLKKYLTNEQMASALKETDLLIGRAGAHTIYELLVFKKPAVLIPLPFSFGQEQLKNARLVESFGLALVIEQKNLFGNNLYQAIGKALKLKISQKLEIKLDACQVIVKEIEHYLKCLKKSDC